MPLLPAVDTIDPAWQAVLDNMLDRVEQAKVFYQTADQETASQWRQQIAATRAKFAQRDVKLSNKLQHSRHLHSSRLRQRKKLNKARTF